MRRTAEQVFIPFTDRRRHPHASTTPGALLRAGADKVSINTAAVDRPELIAEIAAEFGTQCVVVAIDARRRPADDPTPRLRGVHPRRSHTDRARRRRVGRAGRARSGPGEILLTSMDRDGTRDGFDIELDPRGRRRGRASR